MRGNRPKVRSVHAAHTINATPPDWLGHHAKSVWRETIAALEAENRPLGQLNRQALVGLCDAAGLVRECAEVLGRDGMTIDGGREGMKRHPALTTRISALNSLRAYAAELGLTPSSSARLPQPPPPEDENPFSGLMNTD